MRKPVLAAALLVAGAAPALAASPVTLAAAFDNTIISTYEDGRIAKLWLDPDGRYRGEGRRGDASNGRWKVKGEKLCLRQARPLPMLVS